jgi:hypothetical protein
MAKLENRLVLLDFIVSCILAFMVGFILFSI